MKKIYLIVIFQLLIISLSFYKASDEPVNQNIELSPQEINLTENSNESRLELFKEISNSINSENIFISPISIYYILGMTYNESNDKTEKAMRDTLKFSELSIDEINQSYKNLMYYLIYLDNSVSLSIANSVWYKIGFNVFKNFENTGKKYFNAKVEDLDFSSPDAPMKINKFHKFGGITQSCEMVYQNNEFLYYEGNKI
ncbi:MAG: hypothetical protein H0Z29_08990 [Candidatus Marinimicrobia bacterium]|nr:hypothetical protein [Candidatus Neomarinimicrobiota bacterium]